MNAIIKIIFKLRKMSIYKYVTIQPYMAHSWEERNKLNEEKWDLALFFDSNEDLRALDLGNITNPHFIKYLIENHKNLKAIRFVADEFIENKEIECNKWLNEIEFICNNKIKQWAMNAMMSFKSLNIKIYNRNQSIAHIDFRLIETECESLEIYCYKFPIVMTFESKIKNLKLITDTSISTTEKPFVKKLPRNVEIVNTRNVSLNINEDYSLREIFIKGTYSGVYFRSDVYPDLKTIAAPTIDYGPMTLQLKDRWPRIEKFLCEEFIRAIDVGFKFPISIKNVKCQAKDFQMLMLDTLDLESLNLVYKYNDSWINLSNEAKRIANNTKKFTMSYQYSHRYINPEPLLMDKEIPENTIFKGGCILYESLSKKCIFKIGNYSSGTIIFDNTNVDKSKITILTKNDVTEIYHKDNKFNMVFVGSDALLGEIDNKKFFGNNLCFILKIATGVRRLCCEGVFFDMKDFDKVLNYVYDISIKYCTFRHRSIEITEKHSNLRFIEIDNCKVDDEKNSDFWVNINHLPVNLIELIVLNSKYTYCNIPTIPEYTRKFYLINYKKVNEISNPDLFIGAFSKYLTKFAIQNTTLAGFIILDNLWKGLLTFKYDNNPSITMNVSVEINGSQIYMFDEDKKTRYNVTSELKESRNNFNDVKKFLWYSA